MAGLEYLRTKKVSPQGRIYSSPEEKPPGTTLFLSQREGFLGMNYGVGVLALGQEQSFALLPPFNSI